MIVRFAALGMTALLALATWNAQAAALPNPLVWAAYDTGSDAHAQAAAIGRMLRERHGIAVRILPGRSDLARTAPLKSGEAHFSVTGFGIHHAQEGVYEFADRRSWGPLPVRLAFMAQPDAGLGLAVAGDFGFRSTADLAGKRVAWIEDAPTINVAVGALLRFGGLGWDDVQRVEVPGAVVAGNWLVAGRIDAFLATTGSTLATKVAASPRGLAWATFPPGDIPGWRRLTSAAPWFVPRLVTVGVSVPANGLPMASYPAPVLVTSAEQDAGVVHTLVASLDRHFTDFRDAAPGAEGWALDRQVLRWVMPWHEGAIRYFTERGVWGQAEAAHQSRLLERQATIRAAWDSLIAQDIADEQIFLARWQQARAVALREGGFDPVIFGW